MTHFLQATAGVLIAMILCLTLGKEGQDFSAMLTIGVSCMVMLLGASYFQPVLTFLDRLETLGNLDSRFLTCLMKVTGIGMISQIASTVCRDAGRSALGSALQMMACAVVLWLSLPVFSGVLELVQEILGGL